MSAYIASAKWVKMATCFTSSRCSRAGTVSSQTHMRISMATGVERPKAGLGPWSAWFTLSRVPILSVSIDTYGSYVAVSCQLDKVQSILPCIKHWTDKRQGRKTDIVEISRRRKRDLKLCMVCCSWKPQSLMNMPRAYDADCLTLWWEGFHRWRNTQCSMKSKKRMLEDTASRY